MKRSSETLQLNDDDPCPAWPSAIVLGIDEAKFHPREGEKADAFHDRINEVVTKIAQQALGRKDITAFVAVSLAKADPGFYIDFGPIDGRLPRVYGDYLDDPSSKIRLDKKYNAPRFEDVACLHELDILIACAEEIGLLLDKNAILWIDESGVSARDNALGGECSTDRSGGDRQDVRAESVYTTCES